MRDEFQVMPGAHEAGTIQGCRHRSKFTMTGIRFEGLEWEGIMNRRSPLRLFRSALLIGVIVSLTAGGHVLDGGTLPAVGILALLAALTLVPVCLLNGPRLGWPILAILGSGQWMLHKPFTALSHPAVVTLVPARPLRFVHDAGVLPNQWPHLRAHRRRGPPFSWDLH